MTARALLAAAALLATAVAAAQPAPCAVERIESFDAAIEVRAAGTVAVTETIVFCARGEQIKRGIFRDVPTRHRTPLGVYEHRPLALSGASIQPARADGGAFVPTGEPMPALARSEAHGEGVRWYLGSAGGLAPGLWLVTLAYESGRQLRRFDGFDELYWNATGNGWDFAIARATATVALPEGADALRQAGYTGAAGSTETAVAIDAGDPRRVRFAATRALGPREGLTVAVGFTPGVVSIPGPWARALGAFRDNPSSLLGLVLFVAALAALGRDWWRDGRDPARGVVVPLYAPPEGVGPVFARYLHLGRRLDERALPAALLGLAAAGAIRIERTGDEWRLTTLDRAALDGLPPDLRHAGNALFAQQEVDTGTEAGRERLARVREVLAEQVPQQFNADWYRPNRKAVLRGFGIGLPALALLGGYDLAAVQGAVAEWILRCFLLVGGALLLAFVAMVAGEVVGGRLRVLRVVLALLSALLALGLFGMAWVTAGPVPLVAAVAMGAALGVSRVLMPAWTPAGRRKMEALAGFRDYLGVAEADRLNLENPPERVPALFERFLPYAYALGVEQRWAEQFDDVFARIGPQAAAASTHGLAGFDARDFARRIDRSADRGAASMVAAAVAASTASAGAFRGGGSSSSGGGFRSGSSGGGRSGGGGGGGGGGGW